MPRQVNAAVFAGDWAVTGYALANEVGDEFLEDRIMRLTSLLATLFLVGFLGGCGQKGDLYLPDKAASGVTQAK